MRISIDKSCCWEVRAIEAQFLRGVGLADDEEDDVDEEGSKVREEYVGVGGEWSRLSGEEMTIGLDGDDPVGDSG